MSWFFLGMIHAPSRSTAQSPNDTVSIENDEMPLRNVVDILSGSRTRRRMLPSDADMDVWQFELQRRHVSHPHVFHTGQKVSRGFERNDTLGRAGPLAPATMPPPCT